MNPERIQLENIDGALRTWALHGLVDEEVYPVLIAADTLRRAEYDRAFPHLLMSAAVNEEESLAPAGHFLSPAVCYHAYASLEGRCVNNGMTITARGRCFRNEDPTQLVPGRRQIEFEMREVVLVGERDWIESQLVTVRDDVACIASSFGLEGAWEAASDPFFLPSAGGKAAMQRLLGTKLEFCLPSAAGLAVASINRHGSFFGDRFHITATGGAPAHTACIAFGLDRWAAQSSTSPII